MAHVHIHIVHPMYIVMGFTLQSHKCENARPVGRRLAISEL